MADPRDSRNLAPALILLVAVLAVSWAAILIRMAEAPSMAIAFWRLALATLLLSGPAWWFSRRQPSGRAWAHVILPGVLLAIHFALWIGSLARTSVASSVLLVSTQPMFAALATGPLLGEKIPGRTRIAIALAITGTFVLAWGDASLGSSVLLGDVMALAAAAAAAFYLVLGRRARGTGPLPVYLWKVNSIAALTLLAGCLALKTPLAGFSKATWAVFGLLAAGPHLAGHGLLNLAVRSLPAPTVNLALAGEPLLSTSYAAMLFGEFPGPQFYAGSVLILTGLIAEFSGGRGPK